MFGSPIGGSFDELLGSHMQRMNNMMMNSFFGNDPHMNGGHPGSVIQQSQSMSMMPFAGHNNLMAPFGFPNINQMLHGMRMNQMPNNPNCHSFSSSSVMTMMTGPDGKPQVYQASESTRAGPGGVRETKKTVSDSRTGVKKMAIGHHIGDRGHIQEKEKNMFTGQLEENDEYINLEEEEEPEFSKEWQEKTQQYRFHNANHAIAYPQSQHRRQDEYLALPPSSSIENDGKSRKEEVHSKKKTHRSKPYKKSRVATEKYQE